MTRGGRRSRVPDPVHVQRARPQGAHGQRPVASGLLIAVAARAGSLAFALVAIGCIAMILNVIGEMLQGALAALDRMARPAVGTSSGTTSPIVGVGRAPSRGGRPGVRTGSSSSPTPSPSSPWRHGVAIASGRRSRLRLWKVLTCGRDFRFVAPGRARLRLWHASRSRSCSTSRTERIVGWYTSPIGGSASRSSSPPPSWPRTSRRFAPGQAGRPAVRRTGQPGRLLVLLVAVPFGGRAGGDGRRPHPPPVPPEFEENVDRLMQILAVAAADDSRSDTVLVAALTAAGRQNRFLIVAVRPPCSTRSLASSRIPAAERAFGNGAVGAAIVSVATELLIARWRISLRSTGCSTADGRVVGCGSSPPGCRWARSSLRWRGRRWPCRCRRHRRLRRRALALRAVSPADLRTDRGRSEVALAKRRASEGGSRMEVDEHDDGARTCRR